jgi:predicted DNA-binding helix-hairpin-helix protein
MKKAQYFITCNELPAFTVNETSPENIRRILTAKKMAKEKNNQQQLSLIFPE